MSINCNTKNSISNENAILIQYLIRKLESKKNSIDNIKSTLNSLNSIEEFLKYKNATIMFLEELNEDFKQAIYAIKALLTENKALSLSNDAKIIKINKQEAENAFLFSENKDLRKSINEKFENEKDIRKSCSKSPDNTTERNAKNFSNQIKIIESCKKKLKNAVKIHFNKKDNKEYENDTIYDFHNDNFNLNSNELMKKMNEKKQIEQLNKKLEKNIMKKSVDMNYQRNFDKIKTINNENERSKTLKKNNYNNHRRSTTPLNNNYNIKIMKNHSLDYKKSRNKKIEEDKKIFDNYTSPYGGFFEKPKFLGNQKYYPEGQKKTFE